jgi:iron complex outermembrane receptor protein
MRRLLDVTFTALILTCLGCGAVWGAEQAADTVKTLDTVVVTGTRSEQAVEKIPAHVTVITAEDIQNSNAQSIPDLMRSETGISVKSVLGNGKNAQVDLRGFGEAGAYNTLVLVDGRRVNGIDLSGVDWTQIPLDQVERIEIVRGSGGVLYGDNAVGGVINIITKTPAEALAVAGGVSFGSYDRNRQEAMVSRGYKRVAASLSVSREHTDGYRENNEYDTQDFGGKMVFNATETLALKLKASYHEDEFGLPGPLNYAQLLEDRQSTANPHDEGESKDTYVSGGMDWAIGQYGTFTMDLFYRSRTGEAVFPDPTSPLSTETDASTWGLTPRYVWEGDIAAHNHTLIVGIDYYFSEQDTDSFGGWFIPAGTKTATANIERKSIGLYINDDLAVMEKLILSLGARHEKVAYDLRQEDLTGFLGPLDDDTDDSENAFQAGIAYLYSGKSSVFVRTNRSFRFPLTDEIVYTDWSTFKIEANTDLKTQTGQHYEAGITHYITPESFVNLTFFRADIENELFYNPATFGNENHPETRHQGMEVGFKSRLSKTLEVFANYTYEDATFRDDPYKGNNVPAVPDQKGNFGFQLMDLAAPGLSLLANYHYVGPSYAVSDQANNFEKLKAYYTIDARVSYQWKQLKAYVGVNNLTDQEYSEYAVMDTFLTQRYFYPAPERNWVAGLQIVF